jgi:nucleotide-binding universal stress UspA family protein
VTFVNGSLFNKILLHVDGSDASMAAAAFAVDLAAAQNSQLTVVYVVDTATMEYLSQMRIFIKEEKDEFEKDLERTGARYLEYVKTLAAKQGVEPNLKCMRGSIHQIILEQAREEAADAVIIGGWRRTVTRKDATSVERQLILDEAPCPVIVVKKNE